MEFGHVYDSIDDIDFTLPADSEETIATLKANRGDGKLSVYIGASKWGEKSWKGIIYQPRTLDKEFLGIYSLNFNAVEFGPTFYMIYDKEAMAKWNAQVDFSDFKFCPKVPQTITHIRRLQNSDEPTKRFLDSLSGLDGHLGPLLLQLGENFSHKSFTNLKSYLESLDRSIPVAVEIRNKNWFADNAARSEYFSLLRELNVGTIITDTSGRRDVAHMQLTNGTAVIRFVGNDLHATDYLRMDEWVERIATWAEMGLQSLYFFMHQNNEKFVPEACVYLIEKLNAKLGTNIAAPNIITN